MIRLAIWGYGHLGSGVEHAIRQNPDMVLTGIYTRRDPASLHSPFGTPVYSSATLPEHKDEIDVLLLCGGSATDLMPYTPELAKYFTLVDSFDTHAKIPEHFATVDAAAKAAGTVAVISAGWDPGLFSLARVYGLSVLPEASKYTFWGRGVSQGHSNAIRRVPGVRNAVQYTVPIEKALDAVRKGERPEFTARQMHLRECYVVLEEGADPEKVEREIKNMPNYFADYDTVVYFVTEESLEREHGGLPHGGTVILSGKTGNDNTQRVEFTLDLDSNPEFTACVLVACARAAYRMHARGESGCRTMLDIAPRDLSPLSPEEQRRTLL